MQEEVENRVVNLAITTSRLTAQTMVRAIQTYQQHHVVAKGKSKRMPQGKQTVKQLIGQGQGVASVEITKTGIRDFERIARKYGIDYAIKLDRRVTPNRYVVFFRAKDADALKFAFEEYTKKVLKKEKPSVKETLKQKVMDRAKNNQVLDQVKELSR